MSDRRTTEDWVGFIKDLVDEHYDDIECIRLVLDNLSIHNPAVSYEYFEPAEARRILSKPEFHFRPVHGSWLNIAEIEFNVLQGQCLDRRIPDKETLCTEISAWVDHRIDAESDVKWQFTSEDARVKLLRLYPYNDD